jgi:phosphatidylglycerol:prolipoprotein diacylglycerol transferase
VSALDQWLGCAAEGATTGRWDYSAQVCRPLGQDCWAWAEFWSGGLTYYGGFIGASVAAWFILKADRFPFWRAADMAGIVVPLGLGFGRMGCLLAGCCFGKPTDSSLALSFPPFSPAVDWQVKAQLLEKSSMSSLPVHPTQIYESAVALGISAFLLLFLHQRKRYDGHVFLAFVALYAVARAILEVWRSDDRGGLGFLSTSQLIGLAMVAGVFWLHRYRTRTVATATSEAPAAPEGPAAPAEDPSKTGP